MDGSPPTGMGDVKPCKPPIQRERHAFAPEVRQPCQPRALARTRPHPQQLRMWNNLTEAEREVGARAPTHGPWPELRRCMCVRVRVRVVHWHVQDRCYFMDWENMLPAEKAKWKAAFATREVRPHVQPARMQRRRRQPQRNEQVKIQLKLQPLPQQGVLMFSPSLPPSTSLPPSLSLSLSRKLLGLSRVLFVTACPKLACRLPVRD